jgi:hypothetical protein
LLRESFCAPFGAAVPSDFVRLREKKFENALPPPPFDFAGGPLTDLERPFELLPDDGVGGSVEELEERVENSVEAEDELSGARVALSVEAFAREWCCTEFPFSMEGNAGAEEG